MMAHDLSQKGINFKLKSLGIADHFGRSAYMSAELYEVNGLGVGAIVEAAKSL